MTKSAQRIIALNVPIAFNTITTAALHDIVADCLSELERRGEPVEVSRAPKLPLGIDTAWGTISRDDDGWSMSYYEEVSACEAHGLDPSRNSA